MRLEQPPISAEVHQTFLELRQNPVDRSLQTLGIDRVVGGRKDCRPFEGRDRLAGQGVGLGDALDLVAEQLDPDGLLLVRGQHLDHVSPHAEGPAAEVDVVAPVLDLYEPGEDVAAADLLAHLQRQHLRAVGARIPQSIDRRDGSDDDYVAALHQGGRGSETQPINVLIDGCVLLDVRVRGRHVRFGLVVVVVGNEILDRVTREELLQLTV